MRDGDKGWIPLATFQLYWCMDVDAKSCKSYEFCL